jgi:hypothetical protein
MWRNVSDLLAPVAAFNKAALPLWMIVFGCDVACDWLWARADTAF